MEFVELDQTGLIAFAGADAGAFLHSQLTSEVADLTAPRTQYSGYCTPQGRLLATFLLWRLPEQLLLQLPRELAAAIQSRLARYVLRARVKVSDATGDYRLYGLWSKQASAAAAALARPLPQEMHDVVESEGVCATRLPNTRWLLLVAQSRAKAVRAQLASVGVERPLERWIALDIEAGIPEIAGATQERFVPQMVNLDLIGAVSYNKGCYPGQEIVARTHYLGRVKQRMFRARIATQAAPRAGDPLYSSDFGAGQASGTIVSAARAGEGVFEALAVVQTSSAAGEAVRWKTPEGPPLEFLDLPYPLGG